VFDDRHAHDQRLSDAQRVAGQTIQLAQIVRVSAELQCDAAECVAILDDLG
jgi:hypothetical protein